MKATSRVREMHESMSEKMHESVVKDLGYSSFKKDVHSIIVLGPYLACKLSIGYMDIYFNLNDQAHIN